MSDRADLHMHSVHSDGCHEPHELADMAVAAGLRAISLTDHDTIAGWDDFSAACEGVGVEAIPGVELSAHSGSRDTHILGYFVDPAHDDLRAALTEFRQQREERARRMVERLNEGGIGLEFALVREVAGRGAIGRPHVAEALVRAGYVRSFDEAFRRYIGLGKIGYQPKTPLSVRQAIEIIHEAGGLAVLAHPSSYFSERDVHGFADDGLDGVEVVHPKNRPEHTKTFRALAESRGLLTTGGSDFHGADRGEAKVGRPSIPYTLVEGLVEELRKRNGC